MVKFHCISHTHGSALSPTPRPAARAIGRRSCRWRCRWKDGRDQVALKVPRPRVRIIAYAAPGGARNWPPPWLCNSANALAKPTADRFAVGIAVVLPGNMGGSLTPSWPHVGSDGEVRRASGRRKIRFRSLYSVSTTVDECIDLPSSAAIWAFCEAAGEGMAARRPGSGLMARDGSSLAMLTTVTC